MPMVSAVSAPGYKAEQARLAEEKKQREAEEQERIKAEMKRRERVMAVNEIMLENSTF